MSKISRLLRYTLTDALENEFVNELLVVFKDSQLLMKKGPHVTPHEYSHRMTYEVITHDQDNSLEMLLAGNLIERAAARLSIRPVLDEQLSAIRSIYKDRMTEENKRKLKWHEVDAAIVGEVAWGNL